MVRANKTMLPTAAKQNAKKQEGIAKATSAFNTYFTSDIEKKYAEIGLNKSQALKGYLSDSGALGFKAMMMNKDNANSIGVKLIINSIKKWGSNLISTMKADLKSGKGSNTAAVKSLFKKDKPKGATDKEIQDKMYQRSGGFP